ncbi:MMPL family transporter [Dyella caseinilytica]|uniref:MMPL family transporter n=1 Tax=Dyella caseinilytica TaxID=1849581 RepID=A0ABX7GXM9_9GAMM|nr:MMPL family transporter [Dyella caseinilytica]QRN54736.1 MMPL family transporter [Dyella caseinilytica]GFZ96507.1 membrane protein [Dyella caseinilytica]
MNQRGLWLRAGWFGAATLLIALLGAWLLFGRGHSPIQTDLLAMLPATERNPLAEVAAQRLAHANGDRVILLVANADDDRAKAAARQLGQALTKDDVFASVTAELPPFDLQQLVAPYLAHRFSLLTDTDRTALAQADYDPTKTLAQRVNEPFVTGVGTRLQDDPFGWLQHWLDQQPWSRSPLLPEDNLLTAHRDDVSYVMVTATLNGSSYDDAIQHRALQALDQAEQTVEHDQPGTRILRTGALFYAAAARAGAEHDVHLVGVVSTIGIALLLLGVFRSPGPLLLAFLSTAVGVIAATTVSVLVFGQIYLLTLVFGAALLGEAVDYSIQYLSARANAGTTWEPRQGLRQVRPALLLALGTSLLGYALLGLVPFSALRQMACFAMTGMAVACLSVFWLLPALLQRPAKPLSNASVHSAMHLQKLVSGVTSGRRGALLAIVALALAVPGWWQLRHDDDVHLLIAPPVALTQQEAQIRDITGLGNGTQFYLVQGADAEQVLQREEALEQRLQHLVDTNQLQGWLGLAGMVPSLQRQRSNQSLLAPLFAQPDRMRQWLSGAGFRETDIDAFIQAWPDKPLDLQTWLKSPIATPFRYLWMGDDVRDGAASLVLPQGDTSSALLQQAATDLPGVTLVDKPASISELFGRYRRYASIWLVAAILLIVPVFGWRYGWRGVPRVLAPPVVGIGLTLAALGYLHQPLTLFHWMALMLVLGVGANYAVFLREGEPHVTHRPGAMYASVLLSAITALLSFGLLSLSSMPALRDFGLTLLLGIGFTALLVPTSADHRAISS